MIVIHGFPTVTPYFNTTWPGYTTFDYMFTDMWNSIQPAWQHMSDYLNYVGRNQFILQQGSATVDLAFYFYAAPWHPILQYNSTNLQNLGTFRFLDIFIVANEAQDTLMTILGRTIWHLTTLLSKEILLVFQPIKLLSSRIKQSLPSLR